MAGPTITIWSILYQQWFSYVFLSHRIFCSSQIELTRLWKQLISVCLTSSNLGSIFLMRENPTSTIFLFLNFRAIVICYVSIIAFLKWGLLYIYMLGSSICFILPVGGFQTILDIWNFYFHEICRKEVPRHYGQCLLRCSRSIET